MVRRPRLAASLLAGLIAFVAGSLALLPGVAFWDTAELQAVGPLMGTAHPTGFPTYVLVGWLASVVLQPFGEPAFLMNLLSTICVAVAAAVTVDLVRRLTGLLALGIGGRDRAGAHADRLGDGHACRDAHAPPGVRGDPPVAAGGMGGSRPRASTPASGGPAGPGRSAPTGVTAT